MRLDEYAVPDDAAGLEEVEIAVAENVRDAWSALGMIRQALQAKGPVRQSDGLDFLDEAEVLVEAIVTLPAPDRGH